MIRTSVLFFIFLIFNYLSVAQVAPGKITTDSIRKAELYLQVLVDSMVRGSNDQVRQGALAGVNGLFFDILQYPESFHYSFDSLKAISSIKSADGRVRFITWTTQSRELGTYQYFGVVQLLDLKTGELRRTGLTEVKRENNEAEQLELLANEWYPALYYDVIEKKVKKQTYYFLLGWQGNDRFTTRKVIDVMTIDVYNNLLFGHPVFVDEDGKKKRRIIFEYTSEAVMSLKYNKKKKMIVFDHLSPSSPSAKGQYRYYGPDFTYDGFKFKKRVWNYKSNLDLRNPN